MSKRDSLALVVRLPPEFTARVVDRWQELESTLTRVPSPATLSRMELIQMAMQAEQERLELEHRVEVLEPRGRGVVTIRTRPPHGHRPPGKTPDSMS